MSEAFSIGVIGGADGPTAIMVAGRFPYEIFILLAVVIGLLVWYFNHKK